MTKFYPPKKQTPPSMLDHIPSFPVSSGLRFILRDEVEIDAQVVGLEEEDGVIFGLLRSGQNFALPITSVLYVREV